jgi:hypothetical protein
MRTRELNLKVRVLPLPSPSSDPMQVGTMFLRDNVEILDLTLESVVLILHYSFGSSQLVIGFGRFVLSVDYSPFLTGYF